MAWLVYVNHGYPWVADQGYQFSDRAAAEKYLRHLIEQEREYEAALPEEEREGPRPALNLLIPTKPEWDGFPEGWKLTLAASDRPGDEPTELRTYRILKCHGAYEARSGAWQCHLYQVEVLSSEEHEAVQG